MLLTKELLQRLEDVQSADIAHANAVEQLKIKEKAVEDARESCIQARIEVDRLFHILHQRRCEYAQKCLEEKNK